MWVVRAFAKDEDDLVAEQPIAGDFSAQEVRPYLDVSAEDPLYDSYPVTESIAAVLKRHVLEPLDLGKYDYFLEFDADETAPSKQAVA